MLRAYKYRIFPTQEQQVQLANIFGQVRFVYNLGLETKISAYASTQTNVTCFDLNNQITQLKKDLDWLDAPSQALQMSMRNLDIAYHSFFKGKGFPKFKNKHSRQSFQLPQGVRLSDDNKKVFIPKLKWVGVDLHREFSGEVKTVTISRTTTNKYFMSILVDTEQTPPSKKPIKESTAVGIDLGIKDLVITSDGEKFENKEFLKKAQRQLRVAQRSLAKKVVGSNHHTSQKLVVALLHEKIKNQRANYLHQISSHLVNKYDTICLEDLAVKNMSKRCNSRQDEQGNYVANGQSAKTGFNRAILDTGWTELVTMIKYKAEWQGKNIQVIGRFDPSSKTCNCCGRINKELTLAMRTWTCSCGARHDRDVNAAINIKNFGLRNQSSVSQREALACT